MKIVCSSWKNHGIKYRCRIGTSSITANAIGNVVASFELIPGIE
ncbi:MAG: hypothetical protein ACLUU0_00535 [Anaerostipes hadrus]